MADEIAEATQGRGEYIDQPLTERNFGIVRSWLPRWCWNMASNFANIRHEFLDEKKWHYNLAMHQGKSKGPAVILGAGPSLNETGQYLKDWKGPVFCPESMAHTCLYYEHQPEYILLFDAHPNNYKAFLKGVDWKGSTLITNPSATEEIGEWPYDKLYYRMKHEPKIEFSRFKAGMQLEEMAEEIKAQMLGSELFQVLMPIMFPYIECAIQNAGCVANNAIQIANFMGFSPLFLLGLDFGYPNGNDRANGYKLVDGKWTETPTSQVNKSGRPLHRSDNGILTTEEQIEYKLGMFSIMSIEKQQLIDCSAGIITELPKANFAEVVANDGKGYKRDHTEIDGIANRFFDRERQRQTEFQAKRDDDREGEEVRAASGGQV